MRTVNAYGHTEIHIQHMCAHAQNTCVMYGTGAAVFVEIVISLCDLFLWIPVATCRICLSRWVVATF